MPAAQRIELTAAVAYDHTSPTLPLRIAVGTARGVLLPREATTHGMMDPERVRRALNFSIALLALAVVSPLLVLIALLIRLTSPGPVFYLQTRVGIDRRRYQVHGDTGRRRIDYGGRLFTIYKFRTMRVDSDATREVWASPDDPRVTPVGRVLRKYRLDELPQLLNVLRGDMNIVGPRPEQPKIFADLRTSVARYARRQRVLPGITGWAQVNQSYDRTLADVRRKLQLDLEYIENCSAGADLKIMLRTIPVIVFQRGGW